MKRRRRPRLPADIVRITIDNLSHDCRGIGRVNGKTTFIQQALPEEEVEFSYQSIHKDFDEGKLVKLIKSSDDRVEPECRHFKQCGGCSLQHANHKIQIKIKQNILLDLLSRMAHIQPEQTLSPLTSHPWGYRNKARLSVRYVEKKQSTLIGFRERDNPRFIAEISECQVLHQKVGKNITPLRQLIDELEGKKNIAQIEVAAGDNEVALIFRHLQPLSPEDLAKIKQFAENHSYKIFLQPGNEESVHCFFAADNRPFLHYALPEFNLTLQFYPTDFTQVNASVNRLMVQQAMELMQPSDDEQILDLFCGLGNFSLPLARQCAKVIGVEGSQSMVERARMNAKNNGLDNTEFHVANLDDPEQIERIFQFSFNKMLVDPPRSGALELVKAMNKANPQRIVYISCNPVTLARDAGILVNQQGYQLKAAGVMDMFPHTAHVESIALFVKE
ncbi:23S rRNA (uracil(1939)-C(5))-methyltransferase RlmD [Legionella israelensis]|uniref:23S rRNA (uracil(1939)-C(5))-methyltransferase RlmD n=1 Tax=Legionella israelensis TaxID=454 RepID=A0A0W0VLK0_9GAMM|nr:23S rRNA (uracil(1939)-C(5))-methyltransferase RlmD [Legionella israelensis]KTD20829.1 23S rRNA 5-methyluridine methyltransferase [Legionella israelensis]QBS08471.1 23S rRNA (uracil(1939)-C(5))-methyltransferase RlmD [Legionella israelensis]SCY27634.1 23S rRNA m(5)U-1939 methyltransferase [Legionella israelensis DSM 19235]STX58111.1 23S rRNA (uracil-5-)-methyltransferase RumA [Legionella israelensis]